MESNKVKKPDPDESLIEHTIVVSLEYIKIQLNKSARCTIRYKYPLFGPDEFISGTFLIKAGTNESQEIPSLAFWEHIVPSNKMNEKDLETFLHNHPLSIQLFKENTLLGTVTINLGRVYDPESQRKTQQSFKEYMNITSTKAERVSTIGTIECLLVLVKKSCKRCKFCSQVFLYSSIRKHISHSKTCKNAYSDAEMNDLISQSKKRKNEVEVNRQRRNYDKDKRSEKHKKTYDSVKRKENYDPEKRLEKLEKEEEQDRKRRRAEHQALLNKGYEKDARDLNQKKRDAALICPNCRDCEKRQSSDSILVKDKLLSMKKEIEDMYEMFNLEIDSVVEKGKCVEDHQPLYNKLHLKGGSFYHGYHWKLTSDGKLIARCDYNPDLWKYAKDSKTYAEKTWILPDEGTEGYIRDKESNKVLDIFDGFPGGVWLMGCLEDSNWSEECKRQQKWEVSPPNPQGWFTIKNTAKKRFLGCDGGLGEYIGEYCNKLEHAWVDLKSRNYFALKKVVEDLGEEYKCNWAHWMKNCSRPFGCICTICIDVEKDRRKENNYYGHGY